jgi:hypothetical protein
MRKLLLTGVAIALATGIVACKEKAAPAQSPPRAAPKSGWEYTPDDFSIGRKHTPNANCNRQIDRLLDEIRSCFNTHPSQECEATQRKNSEKIGQFRKSRRCAK